MIEEIVISFSRNNADAYRRFGSLLSPYISASALFPKISFRGDAVTGPYAVSVVDGAGGMAGLDVDFSWSGNVRALSLEEFAGRIAPHIAGIDHVGIVIEAESERRNPEFFRAIAAGGACRRDRECEDWLFVVPVTREEFAGGRYVDFTFKRQPKFEIVLLRERLRFPYLQIDIETRLTRAEAEALFPGPEGFGLEGLEQYFRSVWVEFAPEAPPLRFDIRYRGGPGVDEWSSGAHLLRDSRAYVYISV